MPVNKRGRLERMDQKITETPVEAVPSDSRNWNLFVLVSSIALVAGLLLYTVALAVILLWPGSFGDDGPGLQAGVVANWQKLIGAPLSAYSAFVIVFILFKNFPSASTDGVVSIKIFGGEFTGPSGPAMLWIACFLALVFPVLL